MSDSHPTSVRAMTDRILAFREARDWAQFHGVKDEALSLMSEVGELAEHLRWHEGERLQQHVDARRDDIAEELADVLYWTLLLSHDVGVDISEAFGKKMLQNEAKYPVAKAKGRADKYTDL